MRNFDYASIDKRLWDGEILRLIGDIRERKGRLDVYLNEKEGTLSMAADAARLRSIEAANAIENIFVPKSRIKQICAKKAEPQNDGERDVLGYAEAYATVLDEFDSMPARLRYVQQLHRELYGYARGVGGSFKRTHESIKAVDSLGNEIILFTPTTPYETPGAIDEICNKFNRAESEGSVEPLLLIPIFILDFLSIRPFSEGNERVSSLLMSLLLMRSGYSIIKYVSIDGLIEETRSEYFTALRASQHGWSEGREDVIPFVKYVLGILLDAYCEFEARIDIFGEKQSALENVRKEAAVAGKFTKAEMQERCPRLGKTSVESSIRRLVSEGMLTRHGSGRATYYKVK